MPVINVDKPFPVIIRKIRFNIVGNAMKAMDPQHFGRCIPVSIVEEIDKWLAKYTRRNVFVLPFACGVVQIFL